MAKSSCEACTDLKVNSADFYQNGVTDAVCNSLKNDSGFSVKNNHNDCEDLDNANDCLVGGLGETIEGYDECNWRSFMEKMIPNLYQVNKAFICAICGIWTNIHTLWDTLNALIRTVQKLTERVAKLECYIEYPSTNPVFYFGENTAGMDSKLIPGAGVDFSLRSTGSSDPHASDVTLRYMAGGMAYLNGSLRTFIETFTDNNGVSRSGNSAWNFESSGFGLPNGGELLYEIRIKKSEFPQIQKVGYGDLFPTGSNNSFLHARLHPFTEGTYAYGQHGWCNADGTPSSAGYSSGHLVPNGWLFLQVRLGYSTNMSVHGVPDKHGTKQGSNFSPAGYFSMVLDSDEIPCS